MHIQFLTPYPQGQAPSQRFRFEQYLQFLEAEGFTLSFQSFWDDKAWSVLYKPGFVFQKAVGFIKGAGRRLAILFRLSKIDFVFIHRECMPIGPPFAEWIIAHILKKKIIYDFDDAIWLPNTSEENKIVSWLKWHAKVKAICRWSHRISCGNGYLYDFAKQYNQNVVLNPTTIDTENLHNPKHYQRKKGTDCVTIGWTGTHSTLQYLNLIVPVIQSLEKKFGDRIKFMVIADKKPIVTLASLCFISWSKGTEILDLLQFDVGVMPLTDDAWAKGKCGFKALQYMALGIPTVASPSRVNKGIIQDGISGYLCHTSQEWFDQLSLLIEDEEKRKRIGAMGKERVTTNYSVLSNASNFISLFVG